MPSLRQVGFDPTPDYSRLPHDDEAYVMKQFARHAAHCTTCAHPFEVHLRGGTLCTKGHQRALDIAKYLYSKGDRTFSTIDWESNVRTRVEIPAGCDAVRGLLKAMERGLALRRRVPVMSYDENYYVAPRRVQTATFEDTERTRSTRIPLLETFEQPLLVERRPQRREKPRPVGRGSLFEEDIRDRERRRQSRHYEAIPWEAAYPKVDDWD